MRAGALRHRVLLQQPAPAGDTFGGGKDWTDVATVWAAIEPQKGREFSSPATEDKFTDEVTVQITLRYRKDLDATWRIFHPEKGRYYGVLAVVAPYELPRTLILTCRTVDTGEPVK